MIDDDWTHQFVLYEPVGWRSLARWELCLRADMPILKIEGKAVVNVAGEPWSYIVMAHGKIRRPRGARLIRIKGKA